MNPAYSQTIFSIANRPGTWPPEFAIITACNPNGQERGETENAFLTENLSKFLKTKGVTPLPATGLSPDSKHAEPGFLIETTLEDALEIGRDFNQEAIFWIEDGRLSIRACTSTEVQYLGRWEDHLRA